jgi:TRAP-type C4-dicarboxylate transport system permease small subunit
VTLYSIRDQNSAMSIFWKTVDWFNRALKILGACCLVGMMGLTCVDVVGRYFGHPIFGSVELVIFMATLTTALALPYTHEVKGHIGVELFVRLLSSRTQTVIELVTNVLSVALMGLITWRMAVYAGTIRESGQVSMNLEFPEHLIIYAVSFCFLIFTLLIAKDIVSLSRRLLKGEK